MHMRNLWPLLLLLLGAATFLIPGCDKLVTEVNNNTVFDSTTGQYCLTCHGDSVSDSLIEVPRGQWANSRHASSALLDATVDLNGQAYQVNNCGPICHTSQAFVKYTSSGQTGYSPTQPAIIGCATCHMPHSGAYGRYSVDSLRGARVSVTLVNDSTYAMGKSNMCALCHKAKGAPPTSSNAKVTLAGDFGPHFSGQADVLAGEGGYLFGADTVTSSHVSVKALDGCLSCHYGFRTGNLLVPNGQGYDFGAHTFRLENKTTGGQFSANCNMLGCHTGLPPTVGTQGFYTSARIAAIDTLADSLETLLKAKNVLVPSDPSGLSFYADSVVSLDVARILYNYLLYKMDGSRGVHNAKYMQLLLSQSVTWWQDSLPRAKFGFTLPGGNCVPDTVSFADSSSGRISSREWKFGDGFTDTVANPVHVYNRFGSFTVKLIVSGPGGIDSMTIANAVVTDSAAVVLYIITPDSARVGDTITFIDNSTNSMGRIWDFGDGTPTSNDQQVLHTYSAAADYTAMLIIANTCHVDTVTKIIKITP